MKQVNEILLSVMATKKRTEKAEILSQHKDNELLKEVLFFSLNPFIKTNLAKKKLAKKTKFTEAPTKLNDVSEFMVYLETRCSGRDEDVATIQHFINSQDESLRWLYEAMATKNLKIGFTASSINDAYEEQFIPEFQAMLSEKYEDKKRSGKVVENWRNFEGKEVIATKKIDGNRCVIFTTPKGIEMYSRSGKELEGYSELKEHLSLLPVGWVYDGELLATNEEGLNSKELFQKTQKIVRTKGEKTGIEFHAFDLLPIDNFKSGFYHLECKDRKEALKIFVSEVPMVHYVEPLYTGIFDKEIIDNLSEQACEREEEGVMVQLADAPYKCKRVKDILKVKVFQSADLRVMSVYEGTNQNEGKLGGVYVDYKGYTVGVGSGFTKAERELYWENPSLILNKIVEVNYFEETENEDGELSLRFPTFKDIRDDKDEPSYY